MKAAALSKQRLGWDESAYDCRESCTAPCQLFAGRRSGDRVLEDSFRYSLAVFAAPNLAAAVGSFVIDPGHSVDHDEGVSGVAN